MKRRRLPVLIVALVLGGCAGLQQFPVVSNDYEADLKKLDPAFVTALDKINADGVKPEEQKRIRNEEIERRLAVIDAYFKKYEIALAKENVQSDFLVAVIQVGLGGAGAIASQTVSQILSAVGGGLAGVKEAYGKAALFEKALSALIQQMIASRKAILVKIYEGRAQSIVDYPLSAAVQDLDAYYFAGSLPGAVIATSADATVKNNQAEEKLLKILSDQTYGVGDNSAKIEKYLGWDGTQFSNAANVANLNAWKQLNGISIVSNTSFLNAIEWKGLRAKAVKDLTIP